MNKQIPVLGITGYSGSGKTTLLEKLLPELAKKALRISVIKHSHHDVQFDKVGKDSWRMKDAGAVQVAIACDQRWAVMTETQIPISLYQLSQQFDHTLIDLVLVEGFKQEPIPKILLHRQEMMKPLSDIDDNVIALATNYTLPTELPLLDINSVEEIAEFIWRWWRIEQ